MPLFTSVSTIYVRWQPALQPLVVDSPEVKGACSRRFTMIPRNSSGTYYMDILLSFLDEFYFNRFWPERTSNNAAGGQLFCHTYVAPLNELRMTIFEPYCYRFTQRLCQSEHLSGFMF